MPSFTHLICGRVGDGNVGLQGSLRLNVSPCSQVSGRLMYPVMWSDLFTSDRFLYERHQLLRASGSEAVTRCHLSRKENGRFPYAVGFTGSATCLLKLGGKGTRLEIKVRRLGVRTGFLTQEGLDGYIWRNFRQSSQTASAFHSDAS